MKANVIIGWFKIVLGAAAAAAGSGLIHPDPQLTSFILAIYAGLSGGNNVRNGGSST